MGFKDFTTSATADAVVIKEGNDEEENVFVMEGMLEEVENEAEIVFPAADGGIIENKGLDVDDNVTDGAVQPFEIVEADIAVNGRVFKATSDDICPLMRLC